MDIFQGDFTHFVHPAGNQKLPNQVGLIHRMCDELLHTPAVVGHPQGHGGRLTPKTSLPQWEAQSMMWATEVVVTRRQGDAPAQTLELCAKAQVRRDRAATR